MAISKLTVNGVEIPSVKSVTYKETVNSGVDLRPGCVASAYIEAEVYGAQADAVAPGAEVSYYLVDADANETLIGVFSAEPSIKTKNSYKFVAYDNAQKLSADFSAWLRDHQSDFPMTRAALVAAACTIAGVTNATPNWTGSTQTVEAFYADGLTCRDIVSYAAELSGYYVHCHTDGSLYFEWYTDTPDTRIYPSSGVDGSETRYAYKQDGLQYANYTVPAIDGVAVHPSGEDDVAYIYPASPAGDNLLHIRNNLLLTGATAAVYNAAAQRIYNQMAAVGAYVPATAQMFISECPYESGETVLVTDIQGVSFKTIVMSKTVTASGVTLESTGNEAQDPGFENPQKALVQLASDIVQINKLKVSYADIDQAIIDYLTANDVTAQNLTIVDANGYTIATFNADGITLYGDPIAPPSPEPIPTPPGSGNKAVIGPTSFSLYGRIPSATGAYVSFGQSDNGYYYDLGTRLPFPSDVGEYSAIIGEYQVATAHGSSALGGAYNKATGEYSTVVGGYQNDAGGAKAIALGGGANDADGDNSATLGGNGCTANSKSQVVFGEWNVADAGVADERGDYVEIVGNGTSDSARSNARTLGWDGNEWLAGSIDAASGNFRGGATVSGNVGITGGYVLRRLPAVPTAGTGYWLARVTESNGSTSRGGVQFFRSSSSGDGIRLIASDTVNGSTVSNILALYLDSSGNRAVAVSDKAAWQAGLGLVYQSGDTVTMGTYDRFAGDWRDSTNLWFSIPLTKPVASGVSASLSGSVIVISNGTRATVNLANVTQTCRVTPNGIVVNLTWSSAPSYAVASGLANVQAYGATITFS